MKNLCEIVEIVFDNAVNARCGAVSDTWFECVPFDGCSFFRPSVRDANSCKHLGNQASCICAMAVVEKLPSPLREEMEEHMLMAAIQEL